MANTFERTQYEQEVTIEATDNTAASSDVVQETVEKAPESDVVEVKRPLMDKEEERKIKKDRMRFITNKLSSSLALVGLLLNVFYFVSLYKTNNSFFYKYDIGLSVLINLVFMLAVFLCSEGVKNYNRNHSIALIVIGVIELVRIFILPLSAHSAEAMETNQFVRIVVYLACASALLITSGVIGVIRSVTLANYKKSLEEQPA